MSYKITLKDGTCAKHLCVIDDVNKTVSCLEKNMHYDFTGLKEWIFNIGSDCSVIARHNCVIKAGSGCTFDVGIRCMFSTGDFCKFDTEDECTFDTYSNCTFKTGSYCTFNVGYGCELKVGENCSLIRFDVDGVEKLIPHVSIRLNKCDIDGLTVNTQEWCNRYLNDEEGLMLVLKEGEFFSPPDKYGNECQ